MLTEWSTMTILPAKNFSRLIFIENEQQIFQAEDQGRTHGGARGLPPLGPKNTIFSGLLPLNYVIYIFEVGFLKLFVMWED